MIERADNGRLWANATLEGGEVVTLDFNVKMPLIFDPQQFPEGTRVELWVPKGLR